jgi:hypothetical protein
MALDIFVAPSSSPEVLGSREPHLSIPEDGLEGVLKSIRAFTGELSAYGGPAIDEYGTNVFTGLQLESLCKALIRALEQFRAGPVARKVWVGTVVKPEYRELYQDVTKTDLLLITSRLLELAQEAQSLGQALVLVGD